MKAILGILLAVMMLVSTSQAILNVRVDGNIPLEKNGNGWSLLETQQNLAAIASGMFPSLDSTAVKAVFDMGNCDRVILWSDDGWVTYTVNHRDGVHTDLGKLLMPYFVPVNPVTGKTDLTWADRLMRDMKNLGVLGNT
jgi:hypothetical protein